MLEAVLVLFVLVSLFLVCLEVSRRARSRLDVIYASRNLAFDRAMHGCVDGPKVSAGSIDDFSTPPGGPDPDGDKLVGSMQQGAQVSAWGMDIAESSIDAAVQAAPASSASTRVEYSSNSHSWVGCVELNHGSNRPGVGDSDPSRIQNQIFALFPYTWNFISSWLDVHF
ncbi:MAG: hypothetical protein QM756_15910 [Polyangiaceae bacterium]